MAQMYSSRNWSGIRFRTELKSNFIVEPIFAIIKKQPGSRKLYKFLHRAHGNLYIVLFPAPIVIISSSIISASIIITINPSIIVSIILSFVISIIFSKSFFYIG